MFGSLRTGPIKASSTPVEITVPTRRKRLALFLLIYRCPESAEECLEAGNAMVHPTVAPVWRYDGGGERAGGASKRCPLTRPCVPSHVLARI